MKKVVSFLILVMIVTSPMMLNSCAPARWYLVNSEGILSYNRQTGQLELMWYHHSEGAKTDTAKVLVDSVVTKK